MGRGGWEEKCTVWDWLNNQHKDLFRIWSAFGKGHFPPALRLLGSAIDSTLQSWRKSGELKSHG